MDMSFLKDVPGGISKGKTRKQIKARKDREDAANLTAFRDAVWLREENKFFDDYSPAAPGYRAQLAACQFCGKSVRRFKDLPLSGEVHHRIGRWNKATRYEPANGVLLCNHLVNDCHGKAQRHEIEV